MGQKGRGLGHMTYFFNSGTPYCLWMGWSYKRQILQAVWG